MLFKDYVNTPEYEELATRVKYAAAEMQTAIEHIKNTCSDSNGSIITVDKSGNIVRIPFRTNRIATEK